MSRLIPLLVLVLLAPPGVRAEQPPDVNYKLHCMGCHLADGSGGPPAVPDIRGEMGCLLGVEGGREYLVQVPGASQAPISDAELAALVNWMLETFNRHTLPADYTPLTEDEVRRWRPDWLSEVAALRKELMARLAGDCQADGSVAERGSQEPLGGRLRGTKSLAGRAPAPGTLACTGAEPAGASSLTPAPAACHAATPSGTGAAAAR